MSEIINYKENGLPVALEDLSKFIIVGREKLNAVRAGIRAIERLNVAEGVRQQKKEEAQMLAEALLDAEVRIGEILAAMPKAQGAHWEEKRESKSNSTVTTTLQTKEAAAKELGFDRMRMGIQ